jgi:hypothetical protein
VVGIRDQCLAAGVPFFFKQWGEWIPTAAPRTKTKDTERIALSIDGKTSPIARGQGLAYAGYFYERVGKISAGRHLDGIEHNAFPQT